LYLVTPLYTFLQQGISCKIWQLCNANEVLFLVEWDTVIQYTIAILSLSANPLKESFLCGTSNRFFSSSSSFFSSSSSSSSPPPLLPLFFFLTPWELVCVAVDVLKWQQVHDLSVLSCRFHIYTAVFPGSRSSVLWHCCWAKVSQCCEGSLVSSSSTLSA